MGEGNACEVEQEAQAQAQAQAEAEAQAENQQENENQTYDATLKAFSGTNLCQPKQFENEAPDKVLRPNLEAVIHPNVMLEGLKTQDTFEFDPNLFMTVKQYNTVENQEKYHDKKYIKPILSVMMVMKNGNPKSLTCIMLSNDKDELGRLYQTRLEGKKYWFVSPQGTPMGGEPPKDTDPNYELIKSQSDRFLEQVRFINGEASLMAKPKEGISWLSEQTEAKMNFLKNTVLPCFDVKKASGFKKLKSRLEGESKETKVQEKALGHKAPMPLVFSAEPQQSKGTRPDLVAVDQKKRKPTA